MIGVIAWRPGLSTGRIVAEWRSRGLDAALVNPADAREVLRLGDTALVRLDVVPTLDGCEPGLAACGALVQRGVRLLNGPKRSSPHTTSCKRPSRSSGRASRIP